MSDVMAAGLIAACAAIISSALTGFISYRISTKIEKLKILTRKLCSAYNDICAFYQLEIFYSEKIAEVESTTAEAVKRQFREKLRNDGYESPSRYSTPSHISDELKRYES